MHLLLIFVSTFCIINAQEYEDLELNNYDGEFAALNDANLNSIAPSPAPPPPQQAPGKQGFSAGSGLRSIAEGSSNAANDAVNNQDAAGNQAAYVAKNTLAQAAAGASATAQAALAGKQIILQGLEQQFRDAQQGLTGERQQLMQAQRSSDATRRAAQEARAHVNVLTNTLNAAQAAADHVTQAASEAAGELAAQQSMVGSAIQRLQALKKQLDAVRIDFTATRTAAQKAQAAAQAAAANAAAAAAAAASDLARNAGRKNPPAPVPPAPAPKPPSPKGSNGTGGNAGGKQGGGAAGGTGGGKAGGSGGKPTIAGKGSAAFSEEDYFKHLYFGE